MQPKVVFKNRGRKEYVLDRIQLRVKLYVYLENGLKKRIMFKPYTIKYRIYAFSAI